jgi:septum formation protein
MLVLASTSVYRRQLLERLQLRFEMAAPQADETPLPRESPAATALRLAEAKARAVSLSHPNALIIGSDQVAESQGRRLEKPGSHARAVEQLRMLSGRTATFHTGVALLNGQTGRLHSRLVPTRVVFRELSERTIESYLRREQPYDCAGSAKSEGLGIALLRSIEGDDPTALIGLPLIALTDMLQAEGVEVVG